MHQQSPLPNRRQSQRPLILTDARHYYIIKFKLILENASWAEGNAPVGRALMAFFIEDGVRVCVSVSLSDANMELI